MDKKRVKLIEKYSIPFVQLVLEKGEEEQVFEEMIQMKQIFEETGLASFLQNIALDESEKEKSLRFFQSSISSLLENLIEVVLVNNRASLFYDILVDCLHRMEKATNRFEVTISSASPLSAEQKERLIPIIEQKFSLKVRRLNEILDESLIGGFVIRANNKIIDSSIQQQLRAVKENLK